MDFRISEWISGFLDFRLDFWISEWISGFHSGFLDFSLDFCRRCTIRDGPLGGPVIRVLGWALTRMRNTGISLVLRCSRQEN